MKKIFAIVLSAMLLALCFAVSAGAAEYVYYENDFSDAATLSDFTVMKGVWDVVDGQLMLVDFGECDMDDQGWLLFSKDEGIMNLTDYILEVDMINIQTQAGPVVRCDIDNCFPTENSGFCGYQTFISFTATKGAIGYGKLDGNWGGNLLVSDDLLTRGSNIHLKSTLTGTTINYVITDLETGAELWTGEVENDLYAYGTFGFRSCIMKDGITNLGMLGYDNLKVTAIGDVGDHLAAGKPLSTYVPKVKSTAIKPEMTPPVEVVVPEVVEVDASKLDASKTEYVFYENDFSDAATLADFTTYRGNWAIKDGMLYYDSLRTGYEAAGNFAIILYSANHDANLLSNYTVELDVINSQSAAGIISRGDLSKASSEDSSAFYGYISFISNNGTLAAVGKGNFEGGWGGNIKVSEALLTPGNNYHLVVTHNDDLLVYNIYELGSDVPVWTYEGENKDWDEGTFGIRSVSTKDALSNLGVVGFDNMKVTVHGEEAVLLNAGYHPNAKIKGELKIEAPVVTTAPVTAPDATVDADASVAPETTADPDASVAPETTAAPDASVAPETTEAPDVSVAPETTVAPEDDEPAVTTTAPVTAPVEDGGAPVGLIIGIVAAVVVIAAIVAVVLKKKKN